MIWPIWAGCIKPAGWKKVENFLCEQVVIRASRLEKSQKNSLRACSRNRNTRVTFDLEKISKTCFTQKKRNKLTFPDMETSGISILFENSAPPLWVRTAKKFTLVFLSIQTLSTPKIWPGLDYTCKFLIKVRGNPIKVLVWQWAMTKQNASFVLIRTLIPSL